MNRKSVYSLVLAVALAVSFAFPVFADDLATASDTDYSNQYLISNNTMVLASVASPLTACVNGSWRTLDYGDSSQSWVTVPANCTQIAWASRPDSLGDYRILKLDPDGNDMRFSNCFVRLIDAQTIYVNDDFFSHLCDDGSYYFSAYSSVESTIHFDISSGAAFRLYLNSFFPTASNFQPVSVGGVYTSADKPFTMKTAKIDSRSVYPYSMIYHSGQWYNYYFPSGGILKKGYEYSFMFYAGNNKYGGMLRLVSDPTYLAVGVRSGNYMTFTFTPSRNIRTEELQFFIDKQTARVETVPFYYVSSSSTYIPVSDTGQQGQVTAANTTVIKNVVTNISNTVSNISNQITTSTTTITNAVNNVANQVTGSINSQTNTLSDKIQGQTNTITNNQNQNTDKVIKNQDENTDKVVKNQDKNTDKLTKNQDENTNKVTEKLEDVKTGIISGIIEGLKNLFIPSEDFFKSYFDDLYSWFGERLGFLSFPIDLLVELSEMFLGSSSTDCILILPSFSISGFKLWEESSFNLTSFLNENFKFVLDAIKLGTSVILVFNFIHLCERKWEEVMMN